MTSWNDGNRPITIAIVAMGGEGGGVLADWIVAVAERSGFHAQNTSVAGVAQRTGATVYYVEIYPGDPAPEGSVRHEPVMSLFPTPGQVDVVIASELMEAGRAIQRGFATPDRTTLITSTNRVYSMDEKLALGDGRVDSDALLRGAMASAKRLIAADFMELATTNGSVISASLFGALAASQTLPFRRELFEDAITASGKGVAASLRAFAAGFEAAGTEVVLPAVVEPVKASNPVPVTIGLRRPVDPVEAEEERRQQVALTAPSQLVGPELAGEAERVGQLPAPARSMLLHGVVRTAVFQDRSYAQRYLDRVARVAAVDSDPQAVLTTEAARFVALWMSYQDTIQVAQQKIRSKRIEGVRAEAKAGEQLMNVREYLHPQLDEIADTMPVKLGEAMMRSRWFARLVTALTRKGMVVNTTGVIGFTMLWVMAAMRPIRPKSLRWAREQQAIDQWLDLVVQVAAADPALALEIMRCQGVIKGYGETHHHGMESFTVLMDAAHRLAGTPQAAEQLGALRQAALADEDGGALRQALGAAVGTRVE